MFPSLHGGEWLLPYPARGHSASAARYRQPNYAGHNADGAGVIPWPGLIRS